MTTKQTRVRSYLAKGPCASLLLHPTTRLKQTHQTINSMFGQWASCYDPRLRKLHCNIIAYHGTCIFSSSVRVIYSNHRGTQIVFSERELKFMFAICHRRSVCRLSSVCLSSVTFVRPTQTIEIFGNISAP